LKKIFFWLLDIIRDFIPFSSWRSKILNIQGVKVGKNVFIGRGVVIDRVVPHLISIGNNAVITDRVIVLTHDSSHLIRGQQPKVGPIKIESNVFIGVNSVILPGVTIGHNSIIGAGSIVNKNIPPNVKAVGNPARVINGEWNEA
jgi:Acetyltransferase (isoleucine patch superfamily)